MDKQKSMIITCLAFLVIALWGIGPPVAQAMPGSPTDETKVPHYFGPYPNWALSPLPVVDPTTGAISGGIKKFTDQLPGLCMPPACPTSGKYVPLAVPEAKMYNGVEADDM